MPYLPDPELLFLKWAYKMRALDADRLAEFNRRSRDERPDDSILELLVEWEYLSPETIADLLRPEAISRGVAEGKIDASLAPYLEALRESE